MALTSTQEADITRLSYNDKMAFISKNRLRARAGEPLTDEELELCLYAIIQTRTVSTKKADAAKPAVFSEDDL